MNKKIFPSLLLSMLVLLVSIGASSQVIYNQFSPDNVSYHNSGDLAATQYVTLDMDQNGTGDFSVYYSRELLSGPMTILRYKLHVTALNDNKVSFKDMQAGCEMTELFTQEDTIGNGEFINGQGWLRKIDGYDIGYWTEIINGFVGVQLVESGNVH